MSPSTQSWFQPWMVSSISQSCQSNQSHQISLWWNPDDVRNQQSVRHAADVSQDSSWYPSTMCIIIHTHVFNLCCLVEDVSVEVLVNLCSISQGKKRGTAPCTRPRRASGTPCPTTLQIAVNKSEEREELRWSLNTTCCSILYLCLLYLRISVQSCYDVIVLFTLVINCFK